MREKVDEAFDEKTTEEFGQKYLELLYANWFELMRSTRRAVFFATLLVLSFFLLDAETAVFKLGPLETSNVAYVLVLIPAIVSLLLFEAIDLTVAAARYRETTGALMDKLYPSIYQNDLELLLEPPAMFAWGGGSSYSLARYDPEQKLGHFLEEATTVAVVATWVGAVIFFGYAYCALFGGDQASHFVVAGSLAFTVFNVLRASLQIIIFFKED